MIHTCNFCEYQTPYVCNLRRHLTNKHVQKITLHSCICRNCKFDKGYQLQLHKHKFDDTQEAGTQTDIDMQATFQKEDVLKLMDEVFDVFQNYMKMKMQPTGFGSEEMIEECIDVSKYVMKKKISGQYNKE